MLKQYRLVVALLIIGLIGGGYASTVDASASSGSDTPNEGTQMKQKQDSYEQRWEIFLQKCFGWQGHFGHNDQEKNPNEEVEQEPEAEKEPEVQEKPEVEQPEQEQPEQEQQEQPEQEQPEQEQPEQEQPNVENPTDVEEQPSDNNEVGDLNAFEQRVFELTNAEREKNGLAPLQVDLELSKVARDKSQDMLDNQYFSHDSPTYGSPFDMMRAYGIDYRTAGENIAKGQNSPEEVVNAWMNSQGHRENILSSDFTHIGIGYVEQGNIWTQQFIGK